MHPLERLTCVRCVDRATWDAFVDGSEQRSIFARSAFLEALGCGYELWFVLDHDVPALGAIVMMEGDHPRIGPHPLTLYQGLFFGGAHATLPVHTRVATGLELTAALLAALGERYDRLSFCLHPQYTDLRAFSWYNHAQPQAGMFDVSVMYTGIIDVPRDFAAYLAGLRRSRRYEYGRASRDGLRVEVSVDLAELDRLYRSTFARQGIEVKPETAALVQRVAAAAIEGAWGELLICRDAAGRSLSATLFLWDDRTAYYLVGANDPAERQTFSGTYTFLSSVDRCRERGVRAVDVCGMNSPRRGDFKSSFNAEPVAYYVASWERPRGAKDKC